MAGGGASPEQRGRASDSRFAKIAVLGAGSWGTTVAELLAERTETWLWARDASIAEEISREGTNVAYLGDHRLPGSLRATASLEEALAGATLVVVAVPSHGLRSVLAAAESPPPPEVPVLSLAKGLEESGLSRPSEVIAECWAGNEVAVLTGPNLAGEILEGQPAASVVASDHEALGRDIQQLLSSERLRIYTNPDVIGCEIAGAAKNVMAIAAGMAVGLGLGENARAALLTRALAEVSRLGTALGGDPATFAGLAGVGDLVATCTSRRSRNLAAGIALGQGRDPADALGPRVVAEGLRSCRPLVELASRARVEVPVAEQVVAVWHGGRSPLETIPSLMQRSPRSERDTSSA
ncbi:MAG: hypothetical protein JWM85_558 [Acidimicrobiaceae bacterium]|nr:hypothetical protein [Acidimicrobiaceae bacterium]